jgi:hypothetical protein
VLDLPQVTLCCVDARNHALALRALARCRKHIRFARTLFFTHGVPGTLQTPHDIEVVEVGPISSHQAYSRIILKELYGHIATSHVLIVQWDGYVVHPEVWTNEFLDCDYLGAPWPKGNDTYAVGNGGFSLRSRKLLGALRDDGFELLTDAEDVTICSLYKERLESAFDIHFGDCDLAHRFAFEMEAPRRDVGGRTFGFHGFFNFFLTESTSEIVRLMPEISDGIARGLPATWLLKNLQDRSRWEAAIAVGSRILEANPEDEEVAEIVVRACRSLKDQGGGEPRGIGVAARILRGLGVLRS